MVSDNDCDVAVCDIKGAWGFFPTKRFCVHFVYTKSMLAYHYKTVFSFLLFLPDFTLSIPASILLWNNDRRMNIAIFINYVICNTLHSIT